MGRNERHTQDRSEVPQRATQSPARSSRRDSWQHDCAAWQVARAESAPHEAHVTPAARREAA